MGRRCCRPFLLLRQVDIVAHCVRVSVADTQQPMCTYMCARPLNLARSQISPVCVLINICHRSMQIFQAAPFMNVGLGNLGDSFR
jgi:hypothetical protein